MQAVVVNAPTFVTEECDERSQQVKYELQSRRVAGSLDPHDFVWCDVQLLIDSDELQRLEHQHLTLPQDQILNIIAHETYQL